MMGMTVNAQQMVINPQNIEFARGLTNSQKDKRLTMFPEDIKKFVVNSNKEKVVLKELDSTKRNQDIMTKISNQAPLSGNYGTAPAMSNSRAMVAQNNKNLASITTIQSQLTGQQTGGHNTNSSQGLNPIENNHLIQQQHGPRSGTAAPGKRNKINMEAYQAYYNTNEASQNNATQVIQPKSLAQSDNPYPMVEASASSASPTRHTQLGAEQKKQLLAAAIKTTTTSNEYQ